VSEPSSADVDVVPDPASVTFGHVLVPSVVALVAENGLRTIEFDGDAGSVSVSTSRRGTSVPGGCLYVGSRG
jgi:hypothetical protein